MGKARHMKRLKRAVLRVITQQEGPAPTLPSKRYVTDEGRPFVHTEAPSSRWVPLRRTGEDLVQGTVLERWENPDYTVTVRRYAQGFPIGDGPYMVLGLTHVSEQAVHDFRDMQRIKNDLCGEEWEGLELYPAESRLKDPSNHFYLWCVPPGVIPWGLPGTRRVLTMAASFAPQRPFPGEEGGGMTARRFPLDLCGG